MDGELMIRLKNYKCENCGFKFNSHFWDFYFDENNNETVEFLRFFQEGLDNHSRIKGTIIESYCKHCNKFIKTYLCYQYPYDLDEETVSNIIKSGIKEDSDYSRIEVYRPRSILIDDSFYYIKRTFKNLRDFIYLKLNFPINNVYVDCPKCNNRIPHSIYPTEPCPICGRAIKDVD